LTTLLVSIIIEKLLTVWATQRNLKKEIIYKTRVDPELNLNKFQFSKLKKKTLGLLTKT